MTKLAPEWVRTSDPVIRSPARYRWTTAPTTDTFNIYRDKILQSFIDDISSELYSSNDIHTIEVTQAHDGQIDINLHQRQDNSFTATYSIITHNNPYTKSTGPLVRSLDSADQMGS